MKLNNWLTATLIAAMLIASGCASRQPVPRSQRLAEVHQAYDQRDYALSYRKAVQLVGISSGADRDESMYMAGLSAQRLGNDPAAEQYLSRAARSSDPKLAGDALASLGLVYSEQGRYAQAARYLSEAAKRLSGEDRANAYFYAAIAQQKVGQWAQARTNLILARSTTQDLGFRQQITSQLAVTGYSIQTGAYRETKNAQRAAEQLAARSVPRNLGQPRLVASKDYAGRSLTLVQLGRYATFASAQSARQSLGNTQAIIVPLQR